MQPTRSRESGHESVQNEYREEMAGGGDDDASNNVALNGGFCTAGDGYSRVSTSSLSDRDLSHNATTFTSLEKAGLNAHSCSKTKPRSAALTKYNASHRKRLRTKRSNRDEDLRFA